MDTENKYEDKPLTQEMVKEETIKKKIVNDEGEAG